MRSKLPLTKIFCNMEPRITRFLRHHHVLTLCTSSEKGSWTAHCFYTFMADQEALVFTSDPETRHGSEMMQNPNVSGGIMLETKVIGKIQGVQLTGQVMYHENTSFPPEARSAYLNRFPFAMAAKLDLWILYIDYIKMTDNLLGFGKKLEWRRGSEGVRK